MACLLEGKEPVDGGVTILKAEQTTTSGSTTQGDTPVKRRKRENEDSDTAPGPDSVTAPRPNTKQDGTAKTKYGCPVGFTRVTEYVCLHYRNDSNGNAVPSTFEESQKYCQHQNKGASVLYFSNNDEALKTWKWLGKSSSIVMLCLYY